MYILVDISFNSIGDNYFVVDTEGDVTPVRLSAQEMKSWLDRGIEVKGLDCKTYTHDEFRVLAGRDGRRRLAVGQGGVYAARRIELGGVAMMSLRFSHSERLYRLPNFITFLYNDFMAQAGNIVKVGKLVIPESVVAIADGAFSKADCLDIVDLSSSSIISVPSTCFIGSNGLSTVLLPEKLQRIGAAAFKHTTLSALSIPDSVTYLGGQAFYSCNRLVKVKWGMGLSYIPAMCFKYVPIDVLVIPDWITTIHSEAFVDTGCEILVIGRSVSSVKETAIDVSHLRKLIFLGGEENFRACDWMKVFSNMTREKRFKSQVFQIYLWRKYEDIFEDCLYKYLLWYDNYEIIYLDDIPNVDGWLHELREKSIIQE